MTDYEHALTPTYLWRPSDIRALPPSDAIKLGFMKDFTYGQAEKLKKSKFSDSGYLVCTIEFAKTDGWKNLNDTCYPISHLEWDAYLEDEKNGAVRAPLELWVVDRNKYVAPI